MSAADKLAQVLGDVWDDGNGCGLDGWVGPGRGTLPVDDEAVFRRDRAIRKYAAVVLAHLTAEGWAQGAWEYGVRDTEDDEGGVDEIEPPTRDWAERVAAATNAHLRRNGMEGESIVVRRRVTDWEPVEGEQR